MEQYYNILLGCKLFKNFTRQELLTVLTCFDVQIKSYKKGEILLMQGYKSQNIGIVLTGEIAGVKTSINGVDSMAALMGSGEIFGDVLSGSSTKSPITVIARTNCTVMLLNYQKIINPCGTNHTAHSMLLKNMIEIISNKYFAQLRRTEILVCKGLRQKISRYLLNIANETESNTFEIAFNRSELASYLACERTALCRELKRMQKDNLIEYYKNSFKILQYNALKMCI